jgi:hypothetical protein
MKARQSKARQSLALAAAVLLAGVSAASAATPAPAKTKTTTMAKATAMAPQAKDTLTLTAAQRKLAWKDLYTGALNQKTPTGFKASVGAVMPGKVVTAAVTRKAAGDVPALKPYKFAMVQKKLVIVNPSDHKIADVITR